MIEGLHFKPIVSLLLNQNEDVFPCRADLVECQFVALFWTGM
jgi:hypothetical protein